MKHFLITALSISLLTFGHFAKAQEKNFIDQNFVEVTASAFQEASPDEFFLQITIDESISGNKASLESKEKELFNALREMGLNPEKDLQVQDITSSLKNFILKQAKILNSKSYILKVTSPSMVVKIFNAAEKIKISQVEITKTAIANPDKIKGEVLAKAALKAKDNAEILAASLGRKLGKAIFIQNYDGNSQAFRLMGKASGIRSFAASGASDETPDLEFEKIRFDQQVMIRFSLE